ncbi:MAG TPA: hypothetical protein VHC20_02070 [Candidatus Paceibacterota bacterium]|nr:hypothetical protein [Candidatus Paceibacterota bacterium]
MAGRRKEGQELIRSLVKTSGGRSYSISIPIEVIRAFRWEKRQKLELSIDPKRKTITISDWPKK